MLMDIYKDMLRAVARPAGSDYTKANPDLEKVIKLLKQRCAGEFQDTVSAKQRIFFDEPVSLPAKSYNYYIVRAPR